MSRYNKEELFNSACIIDFDKTSAPTCQRDYSRAANTYPSTPSNFNPYGFNITKQTSPSGRLQYDQYSLNSYPNHLNFHKNEVHLPPITAHPQVPYVPQIHDYTGINLASQNQYNASSMRPNQSAINESNWIEYFNTKNQYNQVPKYEYVQESEAQNALNQWNYSNLNFNKYKGHLGDMESHQSNFQANYNRNLVDNVSTIPIFDLKAYNKAKLASINLPKANTLGVTNHYKLKTHPHSLIQTPPGALYAQSPTLINNSNTNNLINTSYLRNLQKLNSKINNYSFYNDIPNHNYRNFSQNLGYKNNNSKFNFHGPIPDFDYQNVPSKFIDHGSLPDFVSCQNNNQHYNFNNASQNFNYNNIISELNYPSKSQYYNFNRNMPDLNSQVINYKKALALKYLQKNRAAYRNAIPDIQTYSRMMNSRRLQMSDINYLNNFKNINLRNKQSQLSNLFEYPSQPDNRFLYQMQNSLLSNDSSSFANPFAVNNSVVFSNLNDNMQGFNSFIF